MRYCWTNSRREKKNSQTRWTLVTVLLLWATLSALTLGGCASAPTKPVLVSVPCPEPATLPASVTESALPDAQNYSEKVQTWLEKVRDFLSELQETRTRSE